MFRTARRRRDLVFAVDLLLLTLDAVRLCLLEGDQEEAQRLLSLGSQSIRTRMNDDSIYDFDVPLSEKLHTSFRHCCASLLVYRVLGLYQTLQYDEMMALLKSSGQEKQQLNPSQLDCLARTCFNVGQSLVKKEDFQSAVTWLNFACSFGTTYSMFLLLIHVTQLFFVFPFIFRQASDGCRPSASREPSLYGKFGDLAGHHLPQNGQRQ